MSDISALALSGLPSVPTVSQSSDNTASTLGMNDFFTLMTAQLQYQDPLEPTDNSQFMAQMAQFALLEQSKTMTTMTNYTAGSALLGKDVLFQVSSLGGTGSTTTQYEGTVSAVDYTSDTPQAYVGGQWVPITSIRRVGLADTTSTGDTTSTTDTASAGA